MLLDVEGRPQRPIGRAQHWQLFEAFLNSPLHTAILTELEQFLSRPAIDSSWAGHDVLAKIQERAPQLMETFDTGTRGRLFGMSLWNFLATRQTEVWHFYKKPTSIEDEHEISGVVYFRPR
jgi:hypothetical protein